MLDAGCWMLDEVEMGYNSCELYSGYRGRFDVFVRPVNGQKDEVVFLAIVCLIAEYLVMAGKN